jgi:alanine dehydrogenase
MPGAVPRTATLALNNATLPFILHIADKGLKTAMLEDPHLMDGLNVYHGHITHEGVAKDLGKQFVPPRQLIF